MVNAISGVGSSWGMSWVSKLVVVKMVVESMVNVCELYWLL